MTIQTFILCQNCYRLESPSRRHCWCSIMWSIPKSSSQQPVVLIGPLCTYPLHQHQYWSCSVSQQKQKQKQFSLLHN